MASKNAAALPNKRRPAKLAKEPEPAAAKPIVQQPNPAPTPKSARPKRLHVSFADDIETISIPYDQETPLDVWNVYSHVAYRTRKEQRFLQRCVHSRIHDVVEQCPSLFSLPGNEENGSRNAPLGRSARRLDGSLVTTLKAQGYGESTAAFAVYVLSVGPLFPVRQRPLVSSKVERSFEAIQNGNRLYVFNEKPNSPIRCGTALRLLHSNEADEASVAIFNPDDRAVIDGYIPLSFIVSLSFGLEPVERERFLKRSGKITCTDGSKKLEESSKRAFTLHCASPEKFYVTFIAATQDDFDNWTRVIDYFVHLNSSFRAFVQTR